jgi:hypothetical protein
LKFAGKKRYLRWLTFFGTRGSEVRILSLRPVFIIH